MNKFEYKNLTPFKWFVLENFPFIEADFDALTDWQLYCKLGKEINKIIDSQNIVGEQAENLTNAFNELQNYINNYFNNLDVQEEINNKLNEMATDGTLENIINQEIFGEINKNITKLNQFVTIEEFKEETDVDDTNAFKLAISDGRPIYLLNKEYNVSEKLTINEQTRIYGKSMTNSIINATHNDYMFEYITPVQSSEYDHKTNIELNNFKVNCKNFIKINENNIEDENWIKQASLLHLLFKNLWINGSYNKIVDNNKNSNIVPDLDTLLNYGCAFNLNNIFDSVISECRIERFGLGILLKGCDINTISNNRINTNGCHLYLLRVKDYGSQNRIIHNDILANLRYGAIHIFNTRYDTIEDNYFECYTDAGCAIKSEKEHGLSIINNRIDNPRTNINIFELEPVSDDKILYNRLNPNSNFKTYCQILPTYATNGNFVKTYDIATFKNNNSGILLKDGALTSTIYDNKNIVSAYNIDYSNISLGGGGYTSPYVTKDDNDFYYFFNTNSANNNLEITFNNRIRLYGKFPKIRIYYSSSNNATTQFVRIDCDDNTLHNNMVNLISDSKIHYIDIDLSSNEVLYNKIKVYLPNKQNVNIYSVNLI